MRDPFTRDEEGRIILGDQQKGCPFCGMVAVKASRENDALYYHPGLGCCLPRLVQELAWRCREDLRYERQLADAGKVLEALDDEIAEAEAEGLKRRVNELRGRRASVAAGVERRRQAIDLQRYGPNPNPEDEGTITAINALTRKMRDMAPTPEVLEAARWQAMAQENHGYSEAELAAIARVLYRVAPVGQR